LKHNAHTGPADLGEDVEEKQEEFAGWLILQRFCCLCSVIVSSSTLITVVAVAYGGAISESELQELEAEVAAKKSSGAGQKADSESAISGPADGADDAAAKRLVQQSLCHFCLHHFALTQSLHVSK